MNTTFESEKNRKALMYTAVICGVLLVLFFLISWKIVPPTVPVVEDLIEINLGNNDEGFGEEQPLIKGEMAPSDEAVVLPQQPASPAQEEEEAVTPDDNAEADAAPVNKPIKTKPAVVFTVILHHAAISTVSTPRHSNQFCQAVAPHFYRKCLERWTVIRKQVQV